MTRVNGNKADSKFNDFLDIKFYKWNYEKNNTIWKTFY